MPTVPEVFTPYETSGHAVEPDTQNRPDGTRTEDLPGLRELWAETTGVPEVCVAVLDGVADLSHPCFRGASLEVADPLDRGRVTDPYARQHGTAIASILFGQHDGPLKGVVPRCRGLLIPIYGPAQRSLRCTQDELGRAIREAVRLGADVINVSGGELVPSGTASRELTGAVQYCTEKGRLLVAAAGNDGCAECLHVPGALPSVLVVGATEPDGRPLGSSNWGTAYRAHGIVAPGRNVRVAVPGGGYTTATGTSLATPLISGVAALLACVQRLRGRRPDPQAVGRALLATTTTCTEEPVDECDRLLTGRLNVPRARAYFLPPLKGQPMTGSAETEAPALAPSAVAPSTAPPEPVLLAAPSPRAVACPVPTTFSSPGVLPSDCGCKGGNGTTAQYVYVIGDTIAPDFGSRVRQLSIQANAVPNDVSTTSGFLRYLLGSRSSGWPLNGNLHDAKSVHWVLYQEKCPVYVVQPYGDFSETLYKALVTFLIETTFNRRPLVRYEGTTFKITAAALDSLSAVEVPDSVLTKLYPLKDREFETKQSFVDELTKCLSPDERTMFQDRILDEAREDTFSGGDSEFITLPSDIRYDCLREYFDCYGGAQRPLEGEGNPPFPPPGQPAASGKPAAPGRPAAPGKQVVPGRVEQHIERSVTTLTGEPLYRSSKVAIAGTLANKRVTLANGKQVEVIYPDLRGMGLWSTFGLFNGLKLLPALKHDRDALLFTARIISRLYELTRNNGKSPQDRAGNWAATAFIQQLVGLISDPTLRQQLGEEPGSPNIPRRSALKNTAVDTISIRPADCQESGGEYDVEVSLFAIDSLLRGLTVVANKVDVSDVVPVTLTESRVFQKRS